jgi:hypothetical protein
MKRLTVLAIVVLVAGLMLIGVRQLLATHVPSFCTTTSNTFTDNSYTVCTDKTDYTPGETVQISGSGFEANASLTVRVTRPDGSIVTGDGTFTPGSDNVTTNENGAVLYTYTLDGISGHYLVEMLDNAGNVLATHIFTDISLANFTHCTNDSNDDGVRDDCEWQTSDISHFDSFSTEGDAVPQRLVLKLDGAGTYTVRFKYDFSKSPTNAYAIDFLTTVDVTQSGSLLNECGSFNLPNFLGANAAARVATCNTLFNGTSGASLALPTIPSDPFDAVSSRETPASRTFRVGCSPACGASVTVSFPSLNGGDDTGEAHDPDTDPDCVQSCGDSTVQIDVTLTTNAADTLVGLWFAAHLAQAADPTPGPSLPDGWGTGFGSSTVSSTGFPKKKILTRVKLLVDGLEVNIGDIKNEIEDETIVPPTTTTTSTQPSGSTTTTSTQPSGSTTSTTLPFPGTTTTTLPSPTTTTIPIVIPAVGDWGMVALGLAFLGAMAWLLRARRSLR